jgi:hypothetical protein
MMSGGEGREGRGGRVKKCFLSLRQTALLSAEGKKKKSGGDQKGQKPQTNTGSYGPVQKARVNALGESETCDGQLYGEGN